MYGSWDMEHETEFFYHFGHFLPTYFPNNPENNNFDKSTKTPQDIIMLYMCTINDNHMMYGSWYMEHSRQNFDHFFPFTW